MSYKHTLSLRLLVLCIFVQNIKCFSRVDPLVETKLGTIRGVRSDDDSYSMYMGIPFATVDPNNPFGPASPHGGFDGVFDAFDDSAVCPQIEEFNNTITGTLDCLHVNIYVPDTATPSNPVPVMTWIYGGGFSIGFSSRFLYGPKFYVRHDVILVTLNYRVGPYGFMCLDSPNVPGNQGLKDQQLALKWIHDNIEAFGGDPNQITIFGESAGGASVDLQLIYNQDKSFQKVILQSGTAQGDWAVAERRDTDAPIQLAERLGYQTNDIEDALTFLATIDTNTIIEINSQLNLNLGPCVEKEFDNVDRFIGIHPYNADLSNVKGVPVMIGHNNDENLSFYFGILVAVQQGIPVPHNIIVNGLVSGAFDFDTETFDEMTSLITQFYFGDENLNMDTIWDLIDLGSDFMFNHPARRCVEIYREIGASNVYYYIFSYVGGRNFVKDRMNLTIGGAAHADEIGYQFDVSYMDEPTGNDQIVVDRISTLWTNFAKYGNPTPETSELIPVKWESVTEETLYYLDINTDLTLKQRPFYDRYTFWDLFYEMNRNLRKGYTPDDQ